MKLVIDVPEGLIYDLQHGCLDNYNIFDLANFIYKGKEQEEQNTAKWVLREEWFEDEPDRRKVWGCSYCGFSIKNIHDKRNYCPNCGSRMKEENQ